MRVGGIVLCGGQSKRMGQPKAWLPFQGETLLARVVGRLGQAVQPIVVVAAPRQDVPTLAGEVIVVRDAVEGRGPLQGLAAGLEALAPHADAAYLSACDVPFLQPAFVRRIIDLLGAHAICVPLVGEYHHSLAAVYRVEVRQAVLALLAQDRLRPVYLFEKVPTRMVGAEELASADPGLDSLINVNGPEEYAQALARSENSLDRQ